MALRIEVLRAMKAAGATTEAIFAAIEADHQIEAEAQAARRAKAAEKKRRQRAAKLGLSPDVPGTHGDAEGQTGTRGDSEGQKTPPAPLDVPLPPSALPPTPLNPPAHPDAGGGEVEGGDDGLDGGEQRRPAKPNSDRGCRIPADFFNWPEVRDTAAASGYRGSDADDVIAEFIDHWTAVPGIRGRKIDWLATFRNRLREIGRRHTTKPPGGGSKPQPQQDRGGFATLNRSIRETYRNGQSDRAPEFDLEPRAGGAPVVQLRRAYG